MLLCLNEVFPKCLDVSFIRISNEFIVVKNKSIQVNPECISGVLMEKKIDRSLYCIKRQPARERTSKIKCFPEKRSQERCECGKENPPSLSHNRIMFPTGNKEYSIIQKVKKN